MTASPAPSTRVLKLPGTARIGRLDQTANLAPARRTVRAKSVATTAAAAPAGHALGSSMLARKTRRRARTVCGTVPDEDAVLMAAVAPAGRAGRAVFATWPARASLIPRARAVRPSTYRRGHKGSAGTVESTWKTTTRAASTRCAQHRACCTMCDCPLVLHSPPHLPHVAAACRSFLRATSTRTPLS